ncbi:MAG: sodium/proline symporter, partial [Cyanobacteria bacterium HKST-UBA01]|nr:sodium/proline symporter [Cyanobacteria bacterium HKST-UBA01]
TGLAAIWLMFGWILGDFLSSLFVHRRLRLAATDTDEVSYAGVLANWYGDPNRQLQRVIGLLSLLFLLTYAGAQLVAGSKALQVLFDWPGWAGAVMGAVMVILYCFAGGIRASIWTDAAQSMVMISAMAILLTVAVTALGGLDGAVNELRSVEGFLNWFPADDSLVIPGAIGGLLFAAGWMFAGLSVIGQPHIMVRFMALEDASEMTRARLWY